MCQSCIVQQNLAPKPQLRASAVPPAIDEVFTQLRFQAQQFLNTLQLTPHHTRLHDANFGPQTQDAERTAPQSLTQKCFESLRDTKQLLSVAASSPKSRKQLDDRRLSRPKPRATSAICGLRGELR